MKQLTRDEMKKVMGGYFPPPGSCWSSGQLCNPVYHNADCCPGLVCLHNPGDSSPLGKCAPDNS